MKQLDIFLCHATEDKPAVRELYRKLKTDGFLPWMDEEDLLPGQNWRLAIARAIRIADAFLVCLSPRSVSKTGYLHKEIHTALDIADEQPEDAIFIIPVKLEECQIPDRLEQWHWLKLFEEQGYHLLLRALQSRAEAVGAQQVPSDDTQYQAAQPSFSEHTQQPRQTDGITIINQAANQGVQGMVSGNITINTAPNRQGEKNHDD